MCARKHAKSSVRLAAVVQMNPNRKHSFQNRGRWLYMPNAGLPAPGTVSGNIQPRLNANRQVLMPGDEPVGAGRLVEQYGPDGYRAILEGFLDEGTDLGRGCEVVDDW